MNEIDELAELEAKAHRVYGPVRLGGPTRAVLWLLRAYVVAMVVFVVVGFAHQLR
jgi:hypothetical protein